MLAAVAAANAKGVFILPGVRAGAMGSAMVAVADEVTAVYYNPAGLAAQEGAGADASFLFLQNDVKGTNSFGNSAAPATNNGDFPLSAYLPSEPSEYENKSLKVEALIPFVGAYQNVDDITFALSVYGSGGGGGKWKDSVSDALTGNDTIKASLDAKYSFTIYNVSAAKKLSPKLSAGIGIDIVTMDDFMNAQKYYTRAAGSIMPMDYDVTLDKKASGNGIQFDGGVIYQINDRMDLGAVLRSGTLIKEKGKAVLNGLQAEYERDYVYPPTCAAGLSYKPTHKLLLAFAVELNKYSLMHETVKYKNYIGLHDENRPLDGRDWNDTTQVRLGAEYFYTEKLALWAGIQTDPVPFKRDQISMGELNQYNYYYYSLGAGYRVGKINVDLAYAYCQPDKAEIGVRSYEFPINIIRLGARYNF